MNIWPRLISPVNAKRINVILGGFYAVVAVSEVLRGILTNVPITEALIYALLFGGPGIVLLYGCFRLPRIRLDPTFYPHTIGWCLGGSGVLLLAVGLLVFNPAIAIDNPIRAVVLAAAFGNAGGFAIGLYAARALTRAHEAEVAHHEVEQHKQQLEREKDRLESFAGMLAHEIRNPLAIAKMYHPRSAEGDETATEQVEKAHNRIEEMIDIILITARGERANIDREKVAIKDVAVSVWEDSSSGAAELVVETDRAVQINPIHFKHLFQNLFKNAIEHGDEDLTIRVGDFDDGFYIEDNGPGIPAETRETVFEAGYTSKSSGIGLGLTFVDQLANLYGWDCVITENEDGGMRFECRGVNLVSDEDQQVD